MSTTESVATSQIPLPTGTWTVDPVHSGVEFHVKHLGIATVKGSFKEFEGTLEVGPSGVSAKGSVKVASVDTREPQRDQHLRSADFFDTDKYPTINFTSTKVTDKGNGEFTLEGELTVTGKTHAVTLQGEYLGAQASPWGDTRIGFSAETEVSRKDWGLEWNVALETGGVLVSDKVKLTIDAEWIKA